MYNIIENPFSFVAKNPQNEPYCKARVVKLEIRQRNHQTGTL